MRRATAWMPSVLLALVAFGGGANANAIVVGLRAREGPGDVPAMVGDLGVAMQSLREAGRVVALTPAGDVLAAGLTPAGAADLAPDQVEAAPEVARMAGAIEVGRTHMADLRGWGPVRSGVHAYPLDAERGALAVLGMTGQISLDRGWIAYLADRGSTPVRTWTARTPLRPPVTGAVACEALSGSPLWYLWPYSGAGWGAERVSVPAGAYDIGGLCSAVADQTSVTIALAAGLRQRRVACSAEGVALRDLLWAVEVATGYQLRAVPAGRPEALLFAEQRPRGERQEPDALLRAPGAGCPNAEGLDLVLGVAPQGSARWPRSAIDPVTYRLAELPCVYREALIRGTSGSDRAVEEVRSAVPGLTVTWVYQERIEGSHTEAGTPTAVLPLL